MVIYGKLYIKKIENKEKNLIIVQWKNKEKLKFSN